MKPTFRNWLSASESKSNEPQIPDNDTLLRRRFANDPCMMHELHRYRRLMLLTILPNISDIDDSSSELHPQVHLRLTRDSVTPTPPIENITLSSQDHQEQKNDNLRFDNSKQILPEQKPGYSKSSSGGYPINETMHNYSFVAAAGGSSDQLSKSVGNLGSGGLAAANARKQIKSASSDGRLPTPKTGVLPAPDRNSNKPEKKCSTNKRLSVMPVTCDGTSGHNVNGLAESDTSELDLLTLAELYLESRHRVFGDEWHQRQGSQARTSGIVTAPGSIGSTGITQRPHRLSPLAAEPLHAPVLPKVSSTKPAALLTGGLHLSVNYTNNLDMEASMILRDRAKALKPRIRRLNSLDDLTNLSVSGDPADPDGSFYRPSSAPDLANKQQSECESDAAVDARSSVDATPARANTPTSALKSTDHARPPLIGASLTTSLVRLKSSRPNTMDSARGASMSPTYDQTKEPKDIFSKNQRSLPTSFRKKSIKAGIKHFTDLDVLKETQAAVKNLSFMKQGELAVGSKTVQCVAATPTSLQARKPVAPIGSEPNSYHETKHQHSPESMLTHGNKLDSSFVKGRDTPHSNVGNRPLHHSLPSRVSTPLAPPPTAVSEHGRKNSRVTLTPLTPLEHRKISAP
ncbi:hypothetical protein FHG87_002886 [Trinorchestia longiramus]|nr:hypothetical protein FHG87_002886 [Trinorchestia longiramus]